MPQLCKNQAFLSYNCIIKKILKSSLDSNDSINKILGSELNKNLLEMEFWAWHQVYFNKLQGP